MAVRRYFCATWFQKNAAAVGMLVGLLVCQSSNAANILMIGNDPEPTFGDDLAVYDFLSDTLGHDVLYLSGNDSTTADGEEADLIVISSTLGSGSARGKFLGLSTPILNWEEALMDGNTAGGNFAMGAGSENGTANPGTQIKILDPTHPLAAGFSGIVEIADVDIPRPHITGSVAPGVKAIASIPTPESDIVLAESGTGVHLGSNQNGGSPFTGLMDEMAIWSRSLSFEVDGNNQLTGGDVFTIFNQGIPALGDNQGLVGYWSFDDVDDDSIAIDGSGNAYDAIIDGGASKNASNVPGAAGGAGSLEVDGTALVNAIDTERPGGELAYSFWFNADSGTYGETFDTSDPRVDFYYGNGDGGTVRPHLSANRNGRPVGIYVADANGDLATPIEATTDSFTTDEWHHVLINWDGETGTVFVDGVLENEVQLGSNSLFAITAVEPGGLLTDGTEATQKVVNFPIQDIGFASLTDDGLALFAAAVDWLINDTPSVPGDFDGDGVLSEADINLLNARVEAGDNQVAFDLTEDGLVNIADINTWVNDLKNTWMGDANLDGEFNSGDFVAVFQSGKFELDVDATWGQGDWNGDLRFNSGDFVVAFQAGGYEQGPKAAVSAVPEPTGIALGLMAMFGLVARHRRRR